MKTLAKQTGKALKQPLTCPKCKSLHYNFQLACKRCGNYMSAADTAGGESAGMMPLIMAGVVSVGAILVLAFGGLHF